MLRQWFLFLQGYLILEINGAAKERFLNLCKNNEIELIQIFSGNSIWHCKIRCRELKKLKQFLKKTGCRIRIKEKHGLPFLIHSLKQRRGILLGSVLFLLIVTQCTGRIWKITVSGGFLHTREQILGVMAEELGVYGGMPKSMADCFEIEKRLRLDYNEIGWISVEKKGCCLHVMLNESTMPKQVEVSEQPCHIVAAQDGIVRKLEVLCGVPLVKAGDEVKKGDILISGIVPIIGDYEELIRNQPVAANGAVYIESGFSYSARCSMTYVQKNVLKKQSGIEIFLWNQKIFSYIPRYSEGKYDIISIDIIPYAFEDYHVPVLFRKYRLLAYETETLHRTADEAEALVRSEWNAFLSDWEMQGVEIVNTEFSSEVTGGVCAASGAITACGNFITYQEIFDEEWKIEDEYSGNNP